MPTQLAERFLARWLDPPERQAPAAGPSTRRQQIIELAKRQIEAQRVTATAIAGSSLTNGKVIAAEIRQQSEALIEEPARQKKLQINRSQKIDHRKGGNPAGSKA